MAFQITAQLILASRALRERRAIREVERGHAFSEMQSMEHDFEAVEVRGLDGCSTVKCKVFRLRSKCGGKFNF